MLRIGLLQNYGKTTSALPLSSVYQHSQEKRTSKSKAVSASKRPEPQEAAMSLRQAPADPEETGTVFFWRETAESYGCFSQWFHHSFHDPSDKSKIFVTAKHWMMCQKAVLFADDEMARRILEAQKLHPREIKKMGLRVKGFNEKVWDRDRVRIVEQGSWFKFTSPANDNTPDLKAILLGTGERELAEASPFDRIWGIGFRAKDAEVARPAWGQNLLGKAMMKTREQVRGESTAEEGEQLDD